MKFVLYCVSALLILAGTACVAAGFDLTTTERGVALTVSGAVCIGAGAIVLGLAGVLQAIKALQKSVEVLITIGNEADRETSRRAPSSVAEAPLLPAVVTVDPLPPRSTVDMGSAAGNRAMLGPLAAGAAVAGAAAAVGAAVGATRTDAAASWPEAPDAETPSALDRDIERALDELLLKPPAESPADGAPDHEAVETGKGPETDLFVAPEDDHPAANAAIDAAEADDAREPDTPEAQVVADVDNGDEDARPQAIEMTSAGEDEEQHENDTHEDSTPDDEVMTATAPAALREAQPASAPAGKKVVGSYAVGENQYTLYADGGVEARTPAGLYQFDSLEDLKVFIESGSKAHAMT
jgi:hypothetical protein